MKKIVFVFMFVFMISVASAATAFWTDTPGACPATNASEFPGQDCSPTDICGDLSGIAQCFDSSTLTAPSSTLSTTDQDGGGFDGGFLIDCFITADASAPFCDNSGNFFCDRNSSIQNSPILRQTNCTNFGESEPGICQSGRFDCFGDVNECEATSTSNCNASTIPNTRYTTATCEVDFSRSNPGTCGCDPGFFQCDGAITNANGCEFQGGATCGASTGSFVLDQCVDSSNANCTSSVNSDCDNDDSDADLTTCNGANGCEIAGGGSCGFSTGSFENSQCVGAGGNCTTAGTNLDCNDDDSDDNILTCNGGSDGCEVVNNSACFVGPVEGTVNGCFSGAALCVVDAQDIATTGVEVVWSGTDPMLWLTQFGSGYILNLTNAIGEFLFGNDGVFTNLPVVIDSTLNVTGDSFLSTTNITVDFSDVSSLVIEDAFDGLSVKNLNPQGGTRIKAENDVGVRTTLFTTGSNATSVDATLVELANLTGLFTLGANMTLAVRSENMSIRMMVFNGTDLTDSLIINGDGSVLLQGPLFLEDENKSIDSETINGGSGMVFSAIEVLTGGETPFVWRAKESDGSNVTLLGLQNGFNNSGGFWQGSMIISSDFGLNDISNLPNLTDCAFMVSQIGGTLRVACDGVDNSSDLIVQGSIQLFETFFSDDSARFQGPNVFVLDGSDLDVFNGTLHIATPIDFVSGFSVGDERIVVRELFTAGIGGFVNLQSDIGDWISVPSGLCGDSPCAQADGAGLGDLIMEQNISTSDINNTKISFVYSIIQLVGGDSFDVELNNGSGFQTIFTDSGTETLEEQVIDLGSDFDNISLVTVRVTCGVSAGKSNRECYFDTFKINGTSMTDTTANVSSFDSRIAFRDGSVDVDGNPNTGIYYVAENDTMFIKAGTVNITGLAGGGGGGIGGSGTANSIAKFTATETLGNSNLVDNGINITSAINFIVEGAITAVSFLNGTFSASQITDPETLNVNNSNTTDFWDGINTQSEITITESQISDLVHTTDTNCSTPGGCANVLYTTNESSLNVNSSDFWDDFNDTNSTWFENVAGTLNIITSFFETEWDRVFNTKDTDDLTEGTTNLYNNNTFNESLTDGKYIQTETDPLWTANQTNYFNKTDVRTTNLNLTGSNISISDSQFICLNQGCTRWIISNSSGTFIQG